MLSVAAATEDIAPGDAVEAETALSLIPVSKARWTYVSRRYKVSARALEPVSRPRSMSAANCISIRCSSSR